MTVTAVAVSFTPDGLYVLTTVQPRVQAEVIGPMVAELLVALKLTVVPLLTTVAVPVVVATRTLLEYQL
jgi:hypothetical protein